MLKHFPLLHFKPVGQPYNIQGYPTIKFFGADKTKPIDFDGNN